MYKIKISIIIPIYNEEKNIGRLIDKIIKIKKKIKKFEILVIDDNSTDNSKLLIEQKQKKHKQLKYILRKDKIKDLSMSVIHGLNISNYENIIVMDGDLQHNPFYIESFLKIFSKKNSDFIIGSRNFKSYTPPPSNQSLSYIRYLSSKFVILINNFLLKINLKDPMSGFFFFKKNIYERNKSKLYGRGFKILLDLIVTHNLNSSKKLNIDEFFINFKTRSYGESKLNLRVIIYYFLFLFKRSI
jgi:dolichol-phosphate mannosyltransferase